ncbi:MAG: metallophosphoesterase family protein [Caulobacterales bacterium]|uniref:metallophosphoesterase family protein n=1 Tax=Glycocaulis sp. TaxID=1969725 RepID=UPI003FA128A0
MPDGFRLYAIGDVHGQADLLDRLLDRIRSDVRVAPPADRAMLVMLGDYVDRGLGSAKVIERLSTLSGMPFAIRCLKGNHEAAMLDFMRDARAGQVWCQYGGGETLASYGVQLPSAQASVDDWEVARKALLSAMPRHHVEFLESLELFVLYEPYVFVHAGLHPDKPLEAQTEQDLLWIRDVFLDSRKRLDHKVVHGHTPEPDYYHDDRRIGVDTGAYLTGTLTAVRLESDEVSFLQVRRSDL